eukprot:c33826_g1_i1 orf=214-486(-)
MAGMTGHFWKQRRGRRAGTVKPCFRGQNIERGRKREGVPAHCGGKASHCMPTIVAALNNLAMVPPNIASAGLPAQPQRVVAREWCDSLTG